jgi:hypothetical protein
MESAETAINQRLTSDRDKMNIQRSVSMILHVLDDYIPHACRRDAYDALGEAMYKDGIELTSKQMRKEYEAWKQLQIDSLGPA